jgi:hypothetical protein
VSSRNARARIWLAALSGHAAQPDASSENRAEAAILACDFDSAASLIANLSTEAATETQSLQAQIMLARAQGQPVEGRVATLISLRGRPLALQASGGVAGESPAVDYTKDIHVYNRIPIQPALGPILPTEASGLSAWLNEPVLAADVGGPGSGLATCR